MEARVVMKNQEMVAVRLSDRTYSVFRLHSPCEVEIGDVFEGQLNQVGTQIVHHVASDSLVEVAIKLAGSQIAAKTKQILSSAALTP